MTAESTTVDTTVVVPLLGGAAYDGLVVLASRDHGEVLATRDVRARSTYEALDVTVELLATGEVDQ